MTPATRSRRWTLALSALALAGLSLLALPSTARAHGDMQEQPPEAHVPEPGSPRPMGGMSGAASGAAVRLQLRLPDRAALGTAFRAEARLTDRAGRAIAGLTIVFEADAVWGEEFRGHMVIGTAVTDRRGIAGITVRPRTSGPFEVAAYFPGSARYRPAMEEADLDVVGSAQLYSPSAGIRIPGLNLWVLAAVIGLVWLTYVRVGLRVVGIARPPRADPATSESVTRGISRRRFLAQALPLGAEASIAAIGAGLIAVVARSPRTHGNLLAPPATSAYHRTPVAHVGRPMSMRPMPAPLDRHVSFSEEVLPIFLRNGGPHVVAPEHSPPPGGLRLDSYRGVMARDGVVVPGKPEESELVQHLLSAAMQMPPSLPPLPDEQIRLIVTWIAQGARDN